jgi:hypothetical protein
MTGIGIIAMGKEHQIRAPGGQMLSNSGYILLCLTGMPLFVFFQPQKGQRAFREAKELTARPLLLFSDFGLRHSSGPREEFVQHPTRARGNNCNINPIAIVPEKPQGDANRVEIIRVWCQDNQA